MRHKLAAGLRGWLVTGLSGLSGSLAATVAAVAAEEPHKGGLPQFDVSTFASQIFWLIVACWGLYYLLVRKGLPRIDGILAERQGRITGDLDRAAALRREAEESLQRYEAMVAEAHARAREQIEASQQRLATEFAQRQEALDADLNAKRQDAERRIGAARHTAMGELATVAADVVQMAIRRLVGIEVGSDESRAAVEHVMQESAS